MYLKIIYLMFSVFKNVQQSNYPQISSDGRKAITLDELVDRVKNYHHLTDKQDYYRSLPNSKEKELYKVQEFPTITVAGEFSYRNKKSMIQYSQYVFGDIDEISPEHLSSVRQVLEEDRNILFIKESLSGNGLHFIFKINQGVDYYRIALLEKYNELIPLIGNRGKLDLQVKDFTRLMIVNSDPYCYYEPSKEIYNVIGNPQIETEMEVDISNLDVSSLEALFNSLLIRIKECPIGNDWVDGNRNNFLINVCRLKMFGVSLSEVIGLTLKYIGNRFTTEYTQNEIIRRLTNNYQSYFKHSITVNISKEPIRYHKYLSEQVSTILTKLKQERFLTIHAPTGSGKTTLVQDIAKRLDLKTDILMPTTALVEQQEGIAQLTGKRKMTVEEIQAPILACCYNSINKVLERNSDLLVVDEAHSLVSDFHWKSSVIKEVVRWMESYKYVIFLTGTPQPLLDWNKSRTLTFQPHQPVKREYSLLCVCEDNDADWFLNLSKEGYLNVFYKNDKSVLDALYSILLEKGKAINYIHSDRKDSDEYQNIINNSLLPEADYLLTTCLIQAGVNIYNTDKPVNIIFGKGCNLVDIIQFTSRFRKIIPQITVLHSGNWGKLSFLNTNEIKEFSRLELNLVQVAERKICKFKKQDWQWTLSKTIHQSSLRRNINGEWEMDEFYQMSQLFKSQTDNSRTNINYFKKVMEEAGWDLIMGTIPSSLPNRVIKDKLHHNKEQKKVAKEKIVKSFWKVSDCEFIPVNEVERILLDRYHFLSEWFVEGELKIHPEYIIENTTYKQLEKQIRFLKDEYLIKSNNLSGSEDAQKFVEAHRYLNLKKYLTVNMEYSTMELRNVIKKCGLDPNCHFSIYLKSVFDYEVKKTIRDKKDVRVVIIKNLITFDSLIQNQTLVNQWIKKLSLPI